jgi:hypothetical protein
MALGLDSPPARRLAERGNAHAEEVPRQRFERVVALGIAQEREHPQVRGLGRRLERELETQSFEEVRAALEIHADLRHLGIRQRHPEPIAQPIDAGVGRALVRDRHVAGVVRAGQREADDSRGARVIALDQKVEGESGAGFRDHRAHRRFDVCGSLRRALRRLQPQIERGLRGLRRHGRPAGHRPFRRRGGCRGRHRSPRLLLARDLGKPSFERLQLVAEDELPKRIWTDRLDLEVFPGALQIEIGLHRHQLAGQEGLLAVRFEPGANGRLLDLGEVFVDALE